MNEHDLLDAIGKTEETVLEASEKRHIPWKFLLTAAACLVLVLSTAFSLISPASDPYTTIAANSNYQIVTDGENTYLRFDKKQKQELEHNANHSISVDWPHYSSVGEMKQAILSGDFTEHVKTHLYAKAKKNDKGDARICNVNQLYEPLLPTGACVRYIEFDGSYLFKIDHHHLNITLYACLDEDDYNSNFAYHYTKRIEENVTKTYEETYQGVLVTVYKGERGQTYKCYDLSTETRSFLVIERYSGDTRPDSIPSEVRFFGKMNGAYYHGWVFKAYSTGLDRRPSIEWLQSFSLKPYEETETE